MAYTTIDNPELYFQAKIYTGNGSDGHAITFDGSENMQPDLVWIKCRSNSSYNHNLYDSARGVTKYIRSNGTGAEVTDALTLKSFNSDGFTLGTDASNLEVNDNTKTYVSWNWKAGTSFTNDASSTGIGTIDSTGSVNTDAGFSIVSFTGTGSAGTIKHGLNSALSIIIVKGRDFVDNWCMFHSSLGGGKKLKLNTTGAEITSSSAWNNTSPTSSVFSVASDGETNNNGSAMIAYCFAEKQGYSKFGSYTGNGNADGTFIYTGFKPAWIMIKRTDSTNNWGIMDNKRSTFNEVGDQLMANTSDAEDNPTSGRDFLSNGFKLRETGNAINASGGTYIYMAFAENPFVTSTGVPATAR